MLPTKVLNLTGLRATQACCTATRYCVAVVKCLYMSWIWTAIWPRGVLWGLYLDSWMVNPRFPRTDSREIRGGSGCMGRSIILDQNKVVLEGDSCLRWGPLWQRLYTCRFTVPSSTTSSLLPRREIEPIWWQMDRHYHLFPAHRYQCASHATAYTHELVDLCDATWIFTRQWKYSVAIGRCPKDDDVLPTGGRGNDAPKQGKTSCGPARMISRSRKTPDDGMHWQVTSNVTN